METVIRERLDRFLGDEAWCHLFTQAEVQHLVRISSDHAPIMMNTATVFDRGKRSKPYRFEAWWLSSSECEEVVDRAWKGNAVAMPHEKVTLCASSLTSWAQKKFGDIKKKLKDREKELKEAQGEVLDGRVLEKCEKLVEEITELRRLEESYWYSRARANEMKDGDKNTAYFHRKASYRRVRNRIDGIYDSEGAWREDEEGIKSTVVKYFENLFQSGNPSDIDETIQCVSPLVTAEMNEILDVVPTTEELVRDVLGVDADLTLAQPLPLMNEEDKAYWRFTKNGQFTVRSCYWMLRGNMAVKLRLYQRHIVTNSSCNICGSPEESIIHALFSCTAATAIWSKSKFEDLIVEAPTSSFIDRWQWLKNKVSKETLILMAALMWAAWRCRNTKVFENFEPDAVQLAMGYCTYVADYKGYSGRVYERAASSLQKHATKWKCPDMGCVKINVDAHLGEQNRAALGVVCRNHTGQLTSTATKSVPLSSPECVEAQAV
uniref:Reverse transcriptase zinc-binding domain-containing protein n=1 Tax=Chenopodium quinoa TaxID=63459 RepID=A0A803M2M8_CHEQI